jgi:hypothetical protein
MNLDTLQRAHLVDFCYAEARHTGSLDCMKAVAYVLRNRRAAGWGDGSWQRLINAAATTAGNDGSIEGIRSAPGLAISNHIGLEPDLNDRLLQMLARDIDDIYLGTSNDDVRRVVEGTVAPEGSGSPGKPAPAMYYQFIALPVRTWFVDNIVRDHENHPRIGQVGMMALFR